MSGTALATTRLASGDNLIRKGTLSGNRLRRHTITATQLDFAQLGTVRSATSAVHASVADNATTAINATNATDALQATDAVELGGLPASSYLNRSDRIGTDGIVTASGSAAGTTVTLFRTGPFTVTMTCTKTGAGTSLTLDASSTGAGAILDHTPAPVADTPTDLGDDVGPETSVDVDADFTISLEAPSGAQAIVTGAEGVNSLGADCWANLAGIA
jgi:hypothetical protein